MGESDAEEGGQRRQVLLEMQRPVLLFCQLCSAGQSSGFFTLLLPKTSCAGKCPSADAVVSLEKDSAGIICSLSRASLRYSRQRTLQ